MLCDSCRKAEATLRLIALPGCRKIEKHYCAACAATSDLKFPVAPSSPSQERPPLDPPRPGG